MRIALFIILLLAVTPALATVKTYNLVSGPVTIDNAQVVASPPEPLSIKLEGTVGRNEFSLCATKCIELFAPGLDFTYESGTFTLEVPSGMTTSMYFDGDAYVLTTTEESSGRIIIYLDQEVIKLKAIKIGLDEFVSIKTLGDASVSLDTGVISGPIVLTVDEPRQQISLHTAENTVTKMTSEEIESTGHVFATIVTKVDGVTQHVVNTNTGFGDLIGVLKIGRGDNTGDITGRVTYGEILPGTTLALIDKENTLLVPTGDSGFLEDYFTERLEFHTDRKIREYCVNDANRCLYDGDFTTVGVTATTSAARDASRKLGSALVRKVLKKETFVSEFEEGTRFTSDGEVGYWAKESINVVSSLSKGDIKGALFGTLDGELSGLPGGGRLRIQNFDNEPTSVSAVYNLPKNTILTAAIDWKGEPSLEVKKRFNDKIDLRGQVSTNGATIGLFGSW